MDVKSRFTKNKQTVRELQYLTIQKHLKKKIAILSYFGLPSDEMGDIIEWKPAFSKFIAVERGFEPDNWKSQHDLMLNAFKNDILSQTIILRGDIDDIILTGKDSYGNIVCYPFDVVTLDYSGGLLYRREGKQYRLQAIRKLIDEQAQHKLDYLLFISSNLDNCEDAEVKRTLENIGTHLQRYGEVGKEVMHTLFNHKYAEVRLKLYVPFFINQVATYVNYNCLTEKVIFYKGNNDIRMMNFRFLLKYDPKTTAPRPQQEHITQIINSPMIEIRNGEWLESSMGVPKLHRIDTL